MNLINNSNNNNTNSYYNNCRPNNDKINRN